MAKYLIAFNDEWVPAQSDEDLRNKSEASAALLAEMKDAGVFLFAEGGISAATAVCHAVLEDGKPVITDGPFAETKEHLGGFTCIEVPDDDAARYWAGRMVAALAWPQEVHRFPATLEDIIERQFAERD